MPNDSSLPGWNSTDDVPVNVRSTSGKPKRNPSVAIGGSGKDIQAPQAAFHGLQSTDRTMMRLSAAVGIGGVLFIATIYFGIGNLRGDVTQDKTASTVVITAAGEFEPTEIQTEPGGEIAFMNQNENPQVIKVKDSLDFIPVQVLFQDPVTVTVPVDANGTYLLYSETLADDKILTITVTNRSGVANSPSVRSVSSSTSSVASSAQDIIPIPFQAGQTQSTSSSVLSVTPHAAAPVSTTHSDETVLISFGGSSSSARATTPSFGEIEINPYTVGKVGALQQRNHILASKGATQLHSGAPPQPRPLSQPQARPQPEAIHYPSKNVDTGPGGVMALFATAFLLMSVTLKKRPA